MGRLGRLSAVVLAGLAALVPTLFLFAWAKGDAPAELLDCLGQLFNESERGAQLDYHIAATTSRGEAKQGIARDLLAGRITLSEAVERFRVLHKTDKLEVLPSEESYSEEQRLARNVLRWTALTLHADGASDNTALRRLRAEAAVVFPGCWDDFPPLGPEKAMRYR